MPTLVPMLQAEYEAFLERTIPEYAADHVRAGNWAESEALEKSRKEFEELLPQGLQTEDNLLFTLYDEREAVGMIWMKVKRQPALSGFIYDVYVDERFRGQGQGRNLMLLIEAKAREMGLKSLELHVFGSNQVARKLYESLDYEITNVLMSKKL